MGFYKIIASDLDGTLLNSDSQVSPENMVAIREIAERGGWFVPASGRTYSEIPENVRKNPDIRYVIHSNGAVILDKKTGERNLACISREQLPVIWEMLKEYEVHVVLRYGGDCYLDEKMGCEAAYQYYNVAPVQAMLAEKYDIKIRDFESFVKTLDDIEVVAASFRHLEELLACQERLMATGMFLTARPERSLLEIFHRDAGKGNALWRLADMLGVDRKATIAVGDSDNDLGMLKAAGLSLVVSNGQPAALEIADKIICSNDEHSAQYICAHYF